MSLIDTSALEAVSRALHSAPNAAIDPKIWQEITRLHAAIKETAALTDAVNNPPGGQYSGVPVNMYLQEQTVVTARALKSFEAYTPARLIYSGGELKADWTYYKSGTNFIYTRADAAVVEPIAAGNIGNFVLKGIVPARVIKFADPRYAEPYSRIYTSSYFTSSNNQNYYGGIPMDRLVGDRDYGIAGVFLHAYQVSTISTVLMYFNPERTWLDKIHTY